MDGFLGLYRPRNSFLLKEDNHEKKTNNRNNSKTKWFMIGNGYSHLLFGYFVNMVYYDYIIS